MTDVDQDMEKVLIRNTLINALYPTQLNNDPDYISVKFSDGTNDWDAVVVILGLGLLGSYIVDVIAQDLAGIGWTLDSWTACQSETAFGIDCFIKKDGMK